MTQQVASVFRAWSGKAFAWLSNRPWQDGDVLFSPDGKTFYALALRGSSSNSDGDIVTKMNLSFDDPHRGVSGRLHYDGNVITYDGETYIQQTDAPALTVIPLPAARRVEYLYLTEDGIIVYVSSDKYNHSYESFRLFAGDGENMREVPVEDVSRYRDGGTTFIDTPEGRFYSPTPSGFTGYFPREASWCGREMVHLNPDDYDILEEGDTVVISKR